MSVTAHRAGAGASAGLARMREDVVDGLSRRPRTLPPKYFYDAEGARLFDAICATPEYYITRTEEAMLEQRAGELAQLIGRGGLLIEPGAGNSRKVQLLLDALQPAIYMPVEICREYLYGGVRELAHRRPGLSVQAVCADFTQLETLPFAPQGLRRTIFFPGSTIGNFEPTAAVALLRRMGGLVGRGGRLIVGVDLHKSRARLEAAYNDAQGVTALFNRNLLARLNRELDAEFDLHGFEHRAYFNEQRSRIEMHLVAVRDQNVCIGPHRFDFFRGETIHTENSYKYTLDGFRRLAHDSGLEPLAAWTDAEGLFSIHVLTVAGD